MDGSAQMVSRWTHKFDSLKGDLPARVLDCPTMSCSVLETGNHVLLHCPGTELVWDHAITLASAAVVGTPAEQRWGGDEQGEPDWPPAGVQGTGRHAH